MTTLTPFSSPAASRTDRRRAARHHVVAQQRALDVAQQDFSASLGAVLTSGADTASTHLTESAAALAQFDHGQEHLARVARALERDALPHLASAITQAAARA